jgi:hypothetical protein
MNLHAGRPGDYIGEPGQTRAADECQGIEESSGEERFRNRGPRRAIPSCNRANDARTLRAERPVKERSAQKVEQTLPRL